MEQPNLPIGELNRYLYTVCYERLLQETGRYLGQAISSIVHHNQIAIEVNEDTAYYTFRAWVSAVDDDKDLRLTCAFHFDDSGCSLSVIDAFDMRQEPYVHPERRGVYTDQHLIPRLHDDDRREEEACRFLSRYCPEALLSPMPVPIRSIMEDKMGLTIVTDIQLIGDNYYGQILFRNDDELVMNSAGDDIMVVPYQRGTVLIDGEKVFLYGTGFGNFTLAHEAYHWFAHRAHVDFHRLVGEQSDSSYNGSSRYSSSDILEIQANAMASRILMPKEMFLRKYHELCDADSSAAIVALASFFEVSYSAAVIRLSQLGALKAQGNPKTQMVTSDDAFTLYGQHEDFRELVDSGKLIYMDNAYVINDPKYVEPVWEDTPTYAATKDRHPYRLTEYALSRPEEAIVTFTIDHKRIAAGGDVLLRESADVLLAPVEYIRSHFPEEAGRISDHAERFERLFSAEQGKHKSFAEVARDLVNYRYGYMEDYDPSSLTDRDWNGEFDMPEVHKQYFEPTRLHELEEKQDALLSQEDYDEKQAKALEAAIEREEDLERSIRSRYQDNLAGRILDEEKHIADDSSSPIDLFCADTLQLHQYYTRIMNGKAANPDPRTLMSLCVGMCLSTKAAGALFNSAGRVLTWDRENMAYRYILTHLRGEYIEEVNLFLDGLGLKPLGSQKQTKN